MTSLFLSNFPRDQWDCSVAISPPITMSAIYRMTGPEEKDAKYIYSRDGNPSLRSLEAALAAVEGGKWANCYATGSKLPNLSKYVVASNILGLTA